MALTFFVVLSLGLIAVCTFLVALLVESRFRNNASGIAVRKWRLAYSRRKSNQMLRKVADLAQVAADDAEQKAKRAAEAVEAMGSYIISEQSTEQIKGIRAENFHAKEKKILRAIEVAKKNGYTLPKDEREQLVRMLKQAHEKAIRDKAERDRQAEVKAEMREEARAQREYERAIKKAEEVARMKQKALEEAIRLLGDTHSEEVQKLRLELAEAQAAAERTKSMAEQTKAGHVYVISNIGSFGDDVFKVGMTRRLEPMNRVHELGDASVPFSFDVHAMISCEDAPALEAALHRDLDGYRVNKVNYRKEYFRVGLSESIRSVEKNHGKVEYEIDPEALEYRESLEGGSADDGFAEDLERVFKST